MSTVDVLFLLLRSALTGEPSRLPKEALTAEAPEALYRLAKKHDVAHLVALALEREVLLPCVCRESAMPSVAASTSPRAG